MNTLNITYAQFEKDCLTLANKLKMCYDTKTITLIAPQRSGLLVTGILSYMIPFKDIFVVKSDRYKHTFDYIYYTPNFLFVDTIIESMKTLNNILKIYLGGDGTKIKIACLYNKSYNKILSVKNVNKDTWIKFPWEKYENNSSQ